MPTNELRARLSGDARTVPHEANGKATGAVARRVFALVAGVAAAVVVAAPAGASQLIDRNATHVQVAVNARGEALLTYSSGGRVKHVLAWGAINALPPAAGASQVKFKVDYAGGWGKYRTVYWRTFNDACKPYSGPTLAWFVAGCTAPDGSYWAVQSFPQPLPDLGFAPWTGSQRAVWLELSHWKGPLAQFTVAQDWIYDGRYNELFGKLTYNGQPVHGFGTTRYGAPTDSFGRLIYLDTLDSQYGQGWRRENSFVPHKPTGAFCYGFFPFDPTKGGYVYPNGQTAMRGPGIGTQYRLTAEGPGVTPDVSWQGTALAPFDKSNAANVTYEQDMTRLLLGMLGTDRSCGGHIRPAA